MEDHQEQETGSNSQPSRGSEADQRAEPVRLRWTPKPEQILILESIFNGGMVNPPKDETVRIRKLLEKFGPVGDANVFYWFQNRRSRSRRRQRQIQASLGAAGDPRPRGGTSNPHVSGYVMNNSAGGSSCVVGPSFGLVGNDAASDGLLSFSGHPGGPSTFYGPSDSPNLQYQSGAGLITVFINGVAIEVGRGAALNMKAMFGGDYGLVHSSGGGVEVNEHGYVVQTLHHGQSYFLADKKELISKVKGEEIVIRSGDLVDIFGFPTKAKVQPQDYREDDDASIRRQLFRVADQDATSNFVRPMLKRKYRLLFDILSHVIMGYSFSPDSITKEKLHCLAALVDKARSVNWGGIFKTVLLQENDEFKIDEDTNSVKLAKRVGNLGKVSVILKHMLSHLQYDSDGFVPFRALLGVNAPLPGKTDDDPNPTTRKRPIKRAGTQSELPKKKLKQTKLTLHLEEGSEEEEERTVSEEPVMEASRRVTAFESETQQAGRSSQVESTPDIPLEQLAEPARERSASPQSRANTPHSPTGTSEPQEVPLATVSEELPIIPMPSFQPIQAPSDPVQMPVGQEEMEFDSLPIQSVPAEEPKSAEEILELEPVSVNPFDTISVHLIRDRMVLDLDKKFPILTDHQELKTKIGGILAWRELRLQQFESFAVVVQELGGYEEFADFDFEMRKVAGVRSPVELSGFEAEEKLVYRLLNLPVPVKEVVKPSIADEAGVGDAAQAQPAEASTAKESTLVITRSVIKEVLEEEVSNAIHNSISKLFSDHSQACNKLVTDQRDRLMMEANQISSNQTKLVEFLKGQLSSEVAKVSKLQDQLTTCLASVTKSEERLGIFIQKMTALNEETKKHITDAVANLVRRPDQSVSEAFSTLFSKLFDDLNVGKREHVIHLIT